MLMRLRKLLVIAKSQMQDWVVDDSTGNLVPNNSTDTDDILLNAREDGHNLLDLMLGVRTPTQIEEKFKRSVEFDRS